MWAGEHGERDILELRGRTIGVAQKLGHDVARLLSSRLGDPREPARVRALDTDHNPQRRAWVALVVLERALVEQR